MFAISFASHVAHYIVPLVDLITVGMGLPAHPWRAHVSAAAICHSHSTVQLAMGLNLTSSTPGQRLIGYGCPCALLVSLALVALYPSFQPSLLILAQQSTNEFVGLEQDSLLFRVTNSLCLNAPHVALVWTRLTCVEKTSDLFPMDMAGQAGPL